MSMTFATGVDGKLLLQLTLVSDARLVEQLERLLRSRRSSSLTWQKWRTAGCI